MRSQLYSTINAPKGFCVVWFPLPISVRATCSYIYWLFIELYNLSRIIIRITFHVSLQCQLQCTIVNNLSTRGQSFMLYNYRVFTYHIGRYVESTLAFCSVDIAATCMQVTICTKPSVLRITVRLRQIYEGFSYVVDNFEV